MDRPAEIRDIRHRREGSLAPRCLKTPIPLQEAFVEFLLQSARAHAREALREVSGFPGKERS